MTTAEALEQAREVLGPGAVVEQRTIAGPAGVVSRCFVGVEGHDPFGWREMGRGESWPEALDAADRGRS